MRDGVKRERTLELPPNAAMGSALHRRDDGKSEVKISQVDGD